jgi:hypothetical protein
MGSAGTVVTTSFARWWRSLPAHGREFASAWVAEGDRLLATRNLDDASCARLRREAIADVVEMVDLLAGSPRDVLPAWVNFYPTWVRAKIADVEAVEPLAFVSALSREHVRREYVRREASERMAVQRAVEVGGRLLALLREAPGGVVRWEPSRVARAISARGPEVRVKPMATALVDAGLAEWDRTPSGRPWALVLKHGAHGEWLEG